MAPQPPTLFPAGQAISDIEAAAARGDVGALMQLAIRYLVGYNITQDISRGRQYLRQAVSIGHVDGALMEVALTANGNGGMTPQDFDGARRRLTIAAKHDPVASSQVELISCMSIGTDGRSTSLPIPEILSDTPHIARYAKLFSPDECAHVATIASDLLEPARIIDPRTGTSMPHPIRTSDGGAIGPLREDLVIRALNLRIAQVSQTDVDKGEPLTVLRYAPGQQYRPHLDTISGARNQRTKTVLVYLNEGFLGGETEFPMIPLSIKPSGGDAIVFANLAIDGTPDHLSRHAGLPVLKGNKWLATRWIRAAKINPWTMA